MLWTILIVQLIGFWWLLHRQRRIVINQTQLAQAIGANGIRTMGLIEGKSEEAIKRDVAIYLGH